MTPDNLIPALRDIVGAAHVLTGDACIEYETDWRQRLQGKALCVVRPGSTAEVAEVMRACAQAGVSIVPQGGNTGLVEGSVPSGGGQQVILSLRRMQAVRAIDLANMTVTVEAGCVLQSLQEAVQDAGMLFPLSLGAE